MTLAADQSELALARGFALSMQRPDLRSDLLAALGASPVREQKLHLGTYLAGSGRPLLHAAARATQRPEEQLRTDLARLGSLELYMPVPEHRRGAASTGELLVVVHLREEAAPFGVNSRGEVVPLSLEGPPATPVLAIVPAESFDASGRPHAAHVRSSSAAGPTLAAGTPWTGIWINEVHVGNTHESWTKGSPEFEMHLENAAVSPRTTIVCAEEDYSVEPYRWDMDGKDYYIPFLVGEQSEVPANTQVVISMWEDDDGRCVLKTLSGYDYVKLTTDALKNAYDAYKAIERKQFYNGAWIMKVLNAYVSYRLVVTGSDDFMGVAAGQGNVTGTARKFVLKDHNRINQGWISVQWRTVVVP